MSVFVIGWTLLSSVVRIVTPAIGAAVRMGGPEPLDVTEFVGEPPTGLAFTSVGKDVAAAGLAYQLPVFEIGERLLDDTVWCVEKSTEIDRCDRLFDTLTEHPVHRLQYLVAPEQVIPLRGVCRVAHWVCYSFALQKGSWQRGSNKWYLSRANS